MKSGPQGSRGAFAIPQMREAGAVGWGQGGRKGQGGSETLCEIKPQDLRCRRATRLDNQSNQREYVKERNHPHFKPTGGSWMKSMVLPKNPEVVAKARASRVLLLWRTVCAWAQRHLVGQELLLTL